MHSFCIFKIALLLRRQQVVPVVDLFDVDLTKFLHVLEHLMGKTDAFARVLKSLRMVLVLTENGAQLQLQLAFLVHASVSLRNTFVLVEFSIAY
jgi:hypothetical protein